MASRSKNEAFHDRWAPRYDTAYEDDPYWRLYRTVTWNHLKPHLPRRLPARVLDLGCGTGEWGLRLLKSGFEVTFLDLSRGMLEQARRRVSEAGLSERAEFVKADIAELGRARGGRLRVRDRAGRSLLHDRRPPRGAPRPAFTPRAGRRTGRLGRRARRPDRRLLRALRMGRAARTDPARQRASS